MSVKKMISAVLSAVMLMSISSAGVAEVNAVEYGIDISSYQGEINWNELKTNDISFAILRAGTSRYGIDSRYEKYYTGVKSIGLKTGAYLFCSSSTLEGFKRDAETFLKYLDGKEMEMPVYIDLESESQPGLGKTTLTTYALAAMNIISDAGYTTGIYSNKNWFTNYVDRELIEEAGYEIWWAQYPSSLMPVNPLNFDKSDVCGIWQYSSRGLLKGITQSTVDLNIAYKTYPAEKKAEAVPELWITKFGQNLSLRCGAGEKFGKLGSIPSSVMFNVKEIKDVSGVKWGRVSYNGYAGWCPLENATKLFFENSPENMGSSMNKGDVNSDGIVDINDDLELRKYVLGASDKKNCPDINGDGKVNLFDSMRIRTKVING